jgi:hypothetical protein
MIILYIAILTFIYLILPFKELNLKFHKDNSKLQGLA